MIIRIAGANGGFSEYLRTGRKQDRKKSRDELDERVILTGDLDLFDRCVDSMSKPGDRYLHIVLSFQEDDLDINVQRAIVKDFKRFAFAAYDEQEYIFYAESHLPRVKSYINEATGEFVERKPHVHIGQPMINIMTGQSLNPFGLIARNIEFIDDFQEYTNFKYGLASPKEFIRDPLFDNSSLIGRVTGSLLDDPGREFKNALAAEVIEGKFDSFEEFVAHVSQRKGVIRHVRAGRKQEFLHVHLPEMNKGINLSKPVFQRWFLDLPAAHRKMHLMRPDTVPYSYISAVPPKDSFDVNMIHAEWPAMDDWYDMRASEIRYINSGSRQKWDAYQKAEPDQRRKLLREAEQRARDKFARHAQSKFEQTNDAPDFLKWPSKQRPQPSASTDRLADNSVSQRARDVREHRQSQRLLSRDDVRNLESRVDARRLLAELSHSHGLIIQKYKTERVTDSAWQVVCGSHRLGLLEFLTREMHMGAADSLALLQHVDRHRHGPDLMPLLAPDPDLWRAYRVWRKAPSELSPEPSLEDVTELGLSRALYLDYLLELATVGDSAALVELRRMQTGLSRDSSDTRLLIEPADGGFGHPGVVDVASLSSNVRRTGEVSYLAEGRKILADVGSAIHVLDHAWPCLAAGLWLACERFDSSLVLKGSPDVQRQAVEAAVVEGLEVVFADPALDELHQKLKIDTPSGGFDSPR
jgi:hypothetical protein